MAKNYTMTEVAIAIATKNEQAIADIGKRYPLLAHKMTALVTKAPDETVDIFNYMPEYLSANKVNKLITTKSDEDVTSDEDAGDDVEEEVTEEPKKAKKPAAKKEEVTESDGGYDTMSTNQLYTILGDLGERKNCKAEFGDFKKASMAAYLAKHHPNGVGEGGEEEPEEEVEEETTGKYDGKKAPELYSLCKKRKIKAEAKKPAKYYIELLEKADEAEAKKAAKKPAKKEEPEEDDDWGDDDAAEDVAEEPAEDDEWEDVKEKPKAKPGRPKKAAAKPKATTKKKEEEPDDDDDDDWDI